MAENQIVNFDEEGVQIVPNQLTLADKQKMLDNMKRMMSVYANHMEVLWNQHKEVLRQYESEKAEFDFLKDQADLLHEERADEEFDVGRLQEENAALKKRLQRKNTEMIGLRKKLLKLSHTH